ncbi:endonuclease/exonuclease/phosphatase family protein [Actinospica robiniae]|uniref:endonuclease/exonuclease/phosphatase family protein n=1 Tax=Actinospica robiniae TaxID=304901 RepID=UPI0004010FE4|nr:endonuclease/exonuclease/phosphatase family protein [Actinospica robiniae]
MNPTVDPADPAVPSSDPARSFPIPANSTPPADPALAPQPRNPMIPAQPGDPFAATAARAEPVAAVLHSAAIPAAAPTVEKLPELTEAEADAAEAADEPGRPGRRRRRGSSMRRQTSTAIAVLGWLGVSFLVLHRYLPDVGGLGSLLETWLPWLALPILVLLAAAGIVHTRRALIATLAAALVWTALYGPSLLPRGSSAPAKLHIFSEDVNGITAEAKASSTAALAENADVVALEDLYAGVAQSSAVSALNAGYKYHVTEYGFGLWSRYPISAVSPVSVGTTDGDSSVSLGVQSAKMAAAATGTPLIGALKATLTVPDGKPLTVFLVHLPQPVLGNSGFAKARDAAFTGFVTMLKADTSPRLAVIGVLNVAATDRQFSQLTKGLGLRSAQQAAGSGFGFTWPAEFPIVRLDDVLTRGLQPLRSSVLPSIAGGQAHLPIEVDLNY